MSDQTFLLIGSNGYIGQRLLAQIEASKTSVVTIDQTDADVVQDLTDLDGFANVLDTVLNQGTDHVGIAFTAGGGPVTHSVERTSEEIQAALAVNLGAPIILLNQLLRFLEGGGRSARCLFFTSIYARRVPDFGIYEHLERRNSEVYGASKAGLESVVRYYAVLGARLGLNVNALSLGGVFNPDIHSKAFRDAYGTRVASGSMVSLEEVVDMALFILTEAPLSMNGAVVQLDGGYGL